jgi:hypothetical protein
VTRPMIRFQSLSTYSRSFLLIAAISLLSSTSFALEDSVVTLTVPRAPLVGPPPVTESFIVSESAPAPAPPATAVLILLPGGNGDIQLTPLVPDGTLDINSSNFLVRVRWLLASQTFVVFTLNAASDFLQWANGLDGYQGSSAHITDVLQVISYARSTYPGLPVWLVGTSHGTAGAFVAAANLPPAGPDDLVFTSPLNVNTKPPNPDSLLSANLPAIVVPTLLLNNKAATCPAALYTGDPAVLAKLTGAPARANQNLNGGFLALSDSCDALSPHGYFGIESATVTKIRAWIKAH